MTPVLAGQEPLVDQLVAAIDAMVALQEETAAELARVSEAIVARNETALEQCGERIRRAEVRLADAAARRDRLRTRLAADLGCAPGDVTLRRLISHVPGPRASALRQLRDRVASAVDAFRVQHLKTATLLVEFARANHAVLSGLLRQGGDARTYRTDGTAPWWTERGLLDARR